MRPRRSVLYVPGANARALEKARTLACDGLILDLEDSVAGPQKTAARELVARVVNSYRDKPFALFVRNNALDSGLALEDLAAVGQPGLDGLLIPKANGPADLEPTGFGGRYTLRRRLAEQLDLRPRGRALPGAVDQKRVDLAGQEVLQQGVDVGKGRRAHGLSVRRVA